MEKTKDNDRYPYVDLAAPLRVARQTEKKVTVEFKGKPLKEAVTQIGKLGGFTVIINEFSLSEQSGWLDEKVSLNVKELSLHNILKLMLEDLELFWFIENEVLNVAGKIDIEERM